MLLTMGRKSIKEGNNKTLAQIILDLNYLFELLCNHLVEQHNIISSASSIGAKLCSLFHRKEITKDLVLVMLDEYFVIIDKVGIMAKNFRYSNGGNSPPLKPVTLTSA